MHKVFVSWFSIFKNWGQDSPWIKIRLTDNHVNQKNTQNGDEGIQAPTKQETQLAMRSSTIIMAFQQNSSSMEDKK